VFSSRPTQGNGLAVVLDAQGLSDDQLQRFAAWTNLAETTFLLPPTDPNADYRVRIFTPALEMPFAGHPTLGSCAAWLHAGGEPKLSGLVRQECPIGIVDIDVSQYPYAFIAPPTSIDAMPAPILEKFLATTGLAADDVVATAALNNGPQWNAFHLKSAQTVLDIDSGIIRPPEFNRVGLIGAHEPGNECDYEVRMLGPSSGMSEDPITGSLNAALAHWMHQRGELTGPVTVAQGTMINRHGRVIVRPDPQGKQILIGGETQILIEGSVNL
jgi:PhzF family phenazine biosynthesis protein